MLLTADGTPKVSDFGLAKSMAADSAQLTRSRAILGTPSYAAPEQVEGVAGPVADVYSLGAILYECLTGRPPFKAATGAELQREVGHRGAGASHPPFADLVNLDDSWVL